MSVRTAEKGFAVSRRRGHDAISLKGFDCHKEEPP
jgi:hypothetical protein